MADTYLITLSPNDELDNVIRKVNHNFKQLSFAQSNKTNQVNRATNQSLQQEVSSVRQDMQTLEQSLTQAIGTLQATLEESITSAVNAAKTEMRNALTPPIGTMMFCSADPGNTYTGTTWTQVTQGTVLLSAGAKYTENSKYELADSSLSSGGSLFTACKLWKRTA